jgi:hypothetical protein
MGPFRSFPLLSEEGWLRRNKKVPFRSAADGVVRNKMLEFTHHPVCAEYCSFASFLLAAQPPLLGEEGKIAKTGRTFFIC